MGKEYGVMEEVVLDIVVTLGKRLANALATIEKSSVGSDALKNKLLEGIQKRWNRSFKLTG